MSILSREGYTVHANDLVQEHIEELTVSPEKQYDDGPVPVFEVFERKPDDTVIVPRHWGEANFGKPTIRFGDVSTADRLSFKGELRSNVQKDACSKSMEQLKNIGGGVLSLHTGLGKTVVSLYIACTLKLKTLVVVHKTFLLDQWVERIQQFVPFARIGRLQQGTVDIDDKDIVVGMLQSIAMREYEQETFDDFGMIIFDEVHVVPAPVFSRALLRLCAPYMLGLSATPERKDGLSKVIHWFIGPVFYEYKLSGKNSVTVFNMPFDIKAAIPGSHLLRPPINRGKIVAMNNLLCNISQRNELLVHIVQDLVLKGHKVIFLSDRRAHCELLKEALSRMNISCALYLGGMKNCELKVSATKNVLLATYSMAKEGLDIPSLDALVLATPKSDVVQACGRILHGKTNLSPVIVDIVDKWFMGEAQFRKRNLYYQNAGFTIKY